MDLFILDDEQLTHVVAPGSAFNRPSGIAPLHLIHCTVITCYLIIL
jgi:hypothetical protein